MAYIRPRSYLHSLAFAATCVITPRLAHAQVVPDVTKELEVVWNVANAESVAAALRYIDESRDETLQEFLQVCTAPGPSQDESFRSRLLFRLFSIYGLEQVHIDDEWNVIGVRRGVGNGPTVVLNAHHDNVYIWPKEQPINPFIADGRVWCPAASDDLIGVVQLLATMRALNAGGVQTQGDIWFASFTGEEPRRNKRSPGAEFFVRSHYPRNLDWRKGDILVQLHGGGGEGVSTGPVNLRHSTQLRVFMPVVREQWNWHALDVLGKIMARVTSEVRTRPRNEQAVTDDFIVINMNNVETMGQAMNESISEVSVRFNFQAQTTARLNNAHDQIEKIAEEVCAQMGQGCSYLYTINTVNGTEEGIRGFDNVNNAPARFAVAAAKVLYGVQGTIAPKNGCGDCVRAYQNGMPAFSLRGSVADHGGGKFTVGQRERLTSRVRKATETHDLTDSVPIDNIWSGAKHALLFATAYTGLAQVKPTQED